MYRIWYLNRILSFICNTNGNEAAANDANQVKANQQAPALLQSAVELLATPQGVRVEVRQSGRQLSVRLSRPGQMAFETEASGRGWKHVLQQAERILATGFASAAPAAPRYTDKYLPALDQSASNMLLPAHERETCRVFALAEWRSDNPENEVGQWAVCKPCPREQWGDLERDELLIYTELYTFGPNDDEPGASTLITHVGRLLVHDPRRGMFYASIWDEGDDENAQLCTDDVQEVWRVTRLIRAA